MKNLENAKIIWQVLRANGVTMAGAAGCLGNILAESSYVPYRVQGDMNESNKYVYSKDYTARVDTGKISKSEFCHNGPGGGGYGLCQWTYWSRKSDLYDYLKAQDLSIGDLVGQAKFLVKELRDRYPAVWSVVVTTDDIRVAMKEVLTKYERPANQGIEAQNKRYNAGKECFDAFSGLAVEKREDYLVNKDFKVLSSGSQGADVYTPQTILKEKGYALGIPDGVFGPNTERAVRSYQSDNGYSITGLVNEKLFNELTRKEVGEEKPTPAPQPEVPKEEPILSTFQITLDSLKKNDEGALVKSMQLLLNGKGYSCGAADGIFGNNTLIALKIFQSSKRLKGNGVCDLETWNALLRA